MSSPRGWLYSLMWFVWECFSSIYAGLVFVIHICWPQEVPGGFWHQQRCQVPERPWSASTSCCALWWLILVFLFWTQNIVDDADIFIFNFNFTQFSASGWASRMPTTGHECLSQFITCVWNVLCTQMDSGRISYAAGMLQDISKDVLIDVFVFSKPSVKVGQWWNSL